MKTILSICIGIVCSLSVSAQIDGPLSGSQFATSEITGYSQTWTNTGNAGASDDSYTSFGNITGGVGGYSDYLIATDFGFNIPDGAIIYGIIVDVERSDPNARTSDYSIRIIRAGLIGTDDRSTGIAYPVTDAYQSYGNSTDLWGETWSYKDICNANFGVAIAAQRNIAGGTTAGQIDHIRITVYYGFVVLPVTLISFDADKENKTVRVGWRTALETNMDQYVVERSGDGRSFYALKTIQPGNQSVNEYSFVDENPVAGTSYYRLKMLEANSTTKFSRIVAISFNKYTTAGLFPSPWTRGNEMNISNPGNESLNILFYNKDGRVLGKSTTTSQQVLMPDLSNTTGLIYYRVTSENNKLRGSGSVMIY